MGNHIAFDSKPPFLHECLSTLQKIETIEGQSYTNFVFIWEVFINVQGLVEESPVHLELFEHFKTSFSYVVLNISSGEENQGDLRPQQENPNKKTLEQLIRSSLQVLSPIGLSETINSNSKFTTSSRSYEIYVWNGEESLPMLKASALALGHKLDKVLSQRSSDTIERLIKRPKLDSSASFLRNDFTLNSPSWNIILQRLHLESLEQKNNPPSKRSFQSLRSTVPPKLTLSNKTTPTKPTSKRLTPMVISIPKQPTPRMDWTTPDDGSTEVDFSSWPAAELIRYFDPLCSKITEYLFLGSKTVAENKDLLLENKITHVLNCAGNVCPSPFQKDFTYKTLYLMDGPHQDITQLFYDILDFIDEARAKDGKIYVHCHQGVSRSCSMVISHIMWKNSWNFQLASEYVKQLRYVCSPNAGFIHQLIMWGKKIQEQSSKTRLYRIGPHQSDPSEVVAKPLENASYSSFDPRTCFVLQTPETLAIWVGSRCTTPLQDVGIRFLKQLQKYEKAPKNIITIREGQELPPFFGFPGQGPIEENSSYDNDYKHEIAKPVLMHHLLPERTRINEKGMLVSSSSSTSPALKLTASDVQFYTVKRKGKEVGGKGEWKFKESESFKSGDLDSDELVLFVAQTSETQVFVWIGDNVDLGDDYNDDEEYGRSAAESFVKYHPNDRIGSTPPKITTVSEGTEDKIFWKYFVNG